MTSVQTDRPVSRGLTPYQVQRLRFSLRRSACSETWVDDQIVTCTDIDADGEEIRCTFFDPHVFPPGGKAETKMRWCRCCGRYTPGPAVQLIEHRQTRFGPVISATLQCDDCRIADDAQIHQELYEAGLHLRPTGSQSVVTRHSLHVERLRKQ